MGVHPILPVHGYFELTVYGPVTFREIEWIEIDPIVHEQVGVRIPDQANDFTTELNQVLAVAKLQHTWQEGHCRVVLD